MPNPRTIEDVLSQYTVDARGCWLWARSRTRGGYGQAWRGPRRWRAHRLSYTHHVGPIPVGLDILHRCDNPPCINPDHLRVGTVQDNADDMVRRGRTAHPWGEAHPSAKLTWGNVRTIRAFAQDGLTQKAAARMFGVHPSVISEILSGKRWAHV